jgi:HD-GYP domain-containing protein (c-di-GMP phosphodiesterase class II)
MSSAPPSDDRSPAPEPRLATRDVATSEFGLGTLVRMRGAPLIEALELHLPGSREHAEATASYAFATAVELDYDRSHSELVRETAKLHEIGKVYVPTEVLAKDPASLDVSEQTQLEGQFEAAYRLAHGAGIPGGVCGWILRTRERFDGRGAEELAADAIPIEARIIRATCACDSALASPATSASSGGFAERRSKAVERLRGEAGRELDPRVVAALATVLDRAAATQV